MFLSDGISCVMMMNGKVKIMIGIAAIAMAGIAAINVVKTKFDEDPVVTSIQAEFVGEVEPGGTLGKSMFEVKGVTESGKLVKLNDFTSKTTKAAANGSTCEIQIEAQGCTATAIINIKRKPVFTQNIGYPNEEEAKVTCYSNGDLEFTGKGEITNFAEELPWEECEYTYVYLDESLNIESMDNWFADNENLVYCDDLPKTVKTIKGTFSNCVSLKKTPGYFQCSNMKIMDYAFSGCSGLKEIDVIPVNASSIKYIFENCTSLQHPINLSKTSNLIYADGMHSGCINLRNASEVPKSVISMHESYQGCINIKEAVQFPPNVQDIASAYEGDTGLITGATVPESVLDFTDCYNGCTSLNGALEINTDTDKFTGALVEANVNGDKLSLSGNSGNLLAIQKDSGNSNIVLADPEAAAQQNERMNREQEG